MTTRVKVANDPRPAWRQKTWDQMAQENALAAVMTTDEMVSATIPSQTHLESFFAKGQALFDRHLKPLLRPGLIVEYGCGPGRILQAVAGAGFQCAGVDISPTMIELGRRLVPDVDLHVLDNGKSALPDGCASMVYSYAVVQHISSLDAYTMAFDEMCRLLAPGGLLVVQVSCDDLRSGLDHKGRTENFELHSVHYPETGAPYRYDQNNWTGVCIGHDLQVRMLSERGLVFDGWRPHKASPSRVWWLSAHRP